MEVVAERMLCLSDADLASGLATCHHMPLHEACCHCESIDRPTDFSFDCNDIPITYFLVFTINEVFAGGQMAIPACSPNSSVSAFIVTYIQEYPNMYTEITVLSITGITI